MAVVKEQICAKDPFFVEPEPRNAAGFSCSLRAVYAEAGTRCDVSIARGTQSSGVGYVSVQCVGLKTPISASLLADLALGMHIDIAPAELLALTADPDPAVELTLVWQRSDVRLRFVRTWDPDLNVGDAIAGLEIVQQRETINRREVGRDRFGTLSSKYLNLRKDLFPATPSP
jgi:hypothetical protein